MEIPDNLKIDVSKTLKIIMLDKKLKQYEVGEKLGMEDRRQINRILQRNDLKVNEIAVIAEAMNCNVKLTFIDNDTGKEWLCDYL